MTAANTTTTTTTSSTLRSYRPQLSSDTVHVLVRDLYGLQVLTCRELDSYDDRNFHVRVDESRASVRNDHLPQLWPHGYVLKVLNSLDSQRPEVTEAKNMMAMTAAQKGFPTPRPVPSVTGQLCVLKPLVRERSQQDNEEKKEEEKAEEKEEKKEEEKKEKESEKKEGEEKKEKEEEEKEEKEGEGEETEVFLVRLMEFLPGSILASVPLTPHLSFQVGQYAARLDHVLKDIDDSKFPKLTVDWNMDNVPSLRKLTRYLDDVEVANVVTEVIDAFETRVLKCESGLRTALIHSDFNDHNILVEPEEAGKEEEEEAAAPSAPSAMRVCGILDFGDATKSFLLIEIAIAMAYMTLMCPPDLDPDHMAAHALAGYLSKFPLNQAELELLPLTICARFSHTVTSGFYRRVLDPGNEYCLVHARKVWAHLKRIWSRPVRHTLSLWRDVVQSYGVKL